MARLKNKNANWVKISSSKIFDLKKRIVKESKNSSSQHDSHPKKRDNLRRRSFQFLSSNSFNDILQVELFDGIGEAWDVDDRAPIEIHSKGLRIQSG